MRLCSLGEKGVLVGARKSREIWVRNKSRLSTSGQQFFRTVYDGAIAVFAGDGFWARYLDKILFLNVFIEFFENYPQDNPWFYPALALWISFWKKDTIQIPTGPITSSTLSLSLYILSRGRT